MIGKRFGMLVVQSQMDKRSANRHIKYECLCDCGRTTQVFASNLRSGRSSSCGCARIKAVTIHGHTRRGQRSGEWSSYSAMLDRCLRSTSHNFALYGGRGIKVQQSWIDDFRNFLHDVGARPTGTTLDRIDTNGDYAAGNVRWATPAEQARNRRAARTARLTKEQRALVLDLSMSGVPHAYIALEFKISESYVSVIKSRGIIV